MTDNNSPSKGDASSVQNGRRRIAPTNISTTPQTGRQPSNPYPFQSGNEVDRPDETDDDEGNQSEDAYEDTRSGEERELWRLSHSFFERRSNDEASTGIRRPNFMNTPSSQCDPLISPPIGNMRYFNLTRVAHEDVFDRRRGLYTELYELRWSGEDVKPISGRELELKFQQEYPGLLRAAVETTERPLNAGEIRSRIYIRVAPGGIRGVAGIVFPIIGSVVGWLPISSFKC